MANAALSAGAIRVVLAGIPGFTAEVVRRCLLGEPDIVVVQCLRHTEGLSALADEETIHVVITARTHEGVPNACQRLLFGDAAVPVIAIATDGWLEVYDRHVLREAAPDELLAEIRKVAARHTKPPQS